jgi:hypothetical protein
MNKLIIKIDNIEISDITDLNLVEIFKRIEHLYIYNKDKPA